MTVRGSQCFLMIVALALLFLFLICYQKVARPTYNLTLSSPKYSSWRSTEEETNKQSYSFAKEMCDQRNLYMNWKLQLAPCMEYTNFNNSIPRNLATSAKLSHVDEMIIRASGEYSTIVIKSCDKLGSPKTIGGDEWRVQVVGPSFVEPQVQDLQDGSYRVSFLIFEAGRYEIKVRLENTLCDGFKDPPFDWIKKSRKFHFCVRDLRFEVIS